MREQAERTESMVGHALQPARAEALVRKRRALLLLGPITGAGDLGRARALPSPRVARERAAFEPPKPGGGHFVRARFAALGWTNTAFAGQPSGMSLVRSFMLVVGGAPMIKIRRDYEA